MKVFSVWRAGPLARCLLTIRLAGERLEFEGEEKLICALRTEGVENLATQSHFDLSEPLVGAKSKEAYQALRARFSRDSAYFIGDESDAEATS